MANICNMCGQSVKEPLSAAGLCRACREGMQPGSNSSSSNQPEANVPAEFRSPIPPEPRRFRWGIYLGGTFFLAIGLLMVAMGAFDSSPRGPVAASTRGGRALGELLRGVFGPRGEEVVLGLFFLAIAFGFAYVSVRRCHVATKLIALGVMAAPV